MPCNKSALALLAFAMISLITLGRAPGAVTFRIRDLETFRTAVVEVEMA